MIDSLLSITYLPVGNMFVKRNIVSARENPLGFEREEDERKLKKP